MSFISSFDIISIVLLCEAEEEEWQWPDPKICLCISVSAADATAVNPKGIKTLFANRLIKFFISGNPVFSYGPRSLPRDPTDCIILDIWVFHNLILVDDLSEKALPRFQSCL